MGTIGHRLETGFDGIKVKSGDTGLDRLQVAFVSGRKRRLE